MIRFDHPIRISISESDGWIFFFLNLNSNPVHNASRKISADGWVPLNISTFWNISLWTLLNVNASITGLWDTEICRALAHLAGSGRVKALDIPITRFHNYLPVTGELWKYLTNGQRLTFVELNLKIFSLLFITLPGLKQLNNTHGLWEWALKLQPWPDVNSLLKVKFEEERSSCTKLRARVFPAFSYIPSKTLFVIIKWTDYSIPCPHISIIKIQGLSRLLDEGMRLLTGVF